MIESFLCSIKKDQIISGNFGAWKSAVGGRPAASNRFYSSQAFG